MPRSNRPPSYRPHRARNLAVVTIAGKDHFLGPYGSPESHGAYARLIARWRAGRRAGVPRWCPNQLRHRCATRVRRLYGLDGAAAVLGHRLGTVTEVYAEADFCKAIAIMREIG
jgi:integrase